MFVARFGFLYFYPEIVYIISSFSTFVIKCILLLAQSRDPIGIRGPGLTPSEHLCGPKTLVSQAGGIMYPMCPLLNLKIPNLGLRISGIVFRDPGLFANSAWGPKHLPPTQLGLRIQDEPRITLKIIQFQANVQGKKIHDIKPNANHNHEKWLLGT